MRNVTGAVAEGEEFFDRVDEMTAFWRSLETDNLLLLAPRRVGKTSLMKRMAEDADHHGFGPLYVDVSDAPDELDFIQRLYRAVLETDAGDRLWNRIKDSWLGQTISRVTKVSGYGFGVEFKDDQAGWTRLGEELADALSRLEGRWLIEVDELPVFLLKLLTPEDGKARGRVREFLYWLRRIRQQFPRVRWLLAGSIGLDTVTARLNIADAINDLQIVTLGAFDELIADALLKALAASHAMDLQAAVRRHAITRAGWPAPYYLQLIFHGLRSVTGPPSMQDVDRVIDDLLGPQHKNYFDYWRQRLFEELGQMDAGYAIALLNAACHAAEGASGSVLNQRLGTMMSEPGPRTEKLRYLLDVLRNDGYLIEDGRNWRFQFPLLREYWLRRVAPQEDHDAE